jgi:gamma-glutamyltranspeptidase
LPDKVYYEASMFSPDTLSLLQARGYEMEMRDQQGVAEVIVVDPVEGLLEGGVDRRVPDGGAAGF